MSGRIGVGLTPEFRPMIASVTLTAGASRMARDGVIVKHLPAIQNSGSIDAFCRSREILRRTRCARWRGLRTNVAAAVIVCDSDAATRPNGELALAERLHVRCVVIMRTSVV
jgi:hypothetical protein